MTFTEIVDEILDRLELNSTDAAARVGRAVNRIYRSVTTTTNLNTTRTVLGATGTIGLGLSYATFSSVEKIVRVYDTSTGNVRDLKEISLLQMREEKTGTDVPTKWAVRDSGATSVTLQFNTVAQAEIPLFADGIVTVADLSGSDVPVIPVSFHDILIEGVLVDEYKKLEKVQYSRESKAQYEQRLSELRYFLAKSAYADIYQGAQQTRSGTGFGGSGSGSSTPGGTSFTQTGLITFDRDPAAPFAVTSGSAMVANLDAQYLNGQTAADFGDVDGAASSTDNAIVRFNGTTGKSIQNSGITIADGATGTLAGSNSGDVTLAGQNYLSIAAQAITAGLINLASHITGRLPYANLVAATAAGRFLARTSASAGDWQESTFGTGLEMQTTALQLVLPSICSGRLTLTTGVPVTTTDVTGATTIYFTPYKGNKISLYDGTNWKLYTFTERSLALGTLTSGLPYDVFIYDNAGTLTLEFTAWTNGTTRATALTTQDGVLVKTGALTRRYLGTFYTTSTTQTEDSYAKRFLWNYYNRVESPMRVLETTDSWAYSTATMRQARASTANQIALIVGVAEDAIDVTVDAHVSSSFAGQSAATVAIGEDSTTTAATGSVIGYITLDQQMADAIQNIGARLQTIPTAGFHFYAWLEYSAANLTTTWYGDNNTPTILQSGISGKSRR